MAMVGQTRLLLRGPFVGGALRGLATVTLRGLKSPSTWMYDSTTYRNDAKNLRVNIAFAPSNSSLYLHMQLFYIPLLYS